MRIVNKRGIDYLLRNRTIGSKAIIKGNIDENDSIMPILQEIMTFVNISGENSERAI